MRRVPQAITVAAAANGRALIAPPSLSLGSIVAPRSAPGLFACARAFVTSCGVPMYGSLASGRQTFLGCAGGDRMSLRWHAFIADGKRFCSSNVTASTKRKDVANIRLSKPTTSASRVVRAYVLNYDDSTGELLLLAAPSRRELVAVVTVPEERRGSAGLAAALTPGSLVHASVDEHDATVVFEVLFNHTEKFPDQKYKLVDPNVRVTFLGRTGRFDFAETSDGQRVKIMTQSEKLLPKGAKLRGALLNSPESGLLYLTRWSRERTPTLEQARSDAVNVLRPGSRVASKQSNEAAASDTTTTTAVPSSSSPPASASSSSSSSDSRRRVFRVVGSLTGRRVRLQDETDARVEYDVDCRAFRHLRQFLELQTGDRLTGVVVSAAAAGDSVNQHDDDAAVADQPPTETLRKLTLCTTPAEAEAPLPQDEADSKADSTTADPQTTWPPSGWLLGLVEGRMRKSPRAVVKLSPWTAVELVGSDPAALPPTAMPILLKLPASYSRNTGQSLNVEETRFAVLDNTKIPKKVLRTVAEATVTRVEGNTHIAEAHSGTTENGSTSRTVELLFVRRNAERLSVGAVILNGTFIEGLESPRGAAAGLLLTATWSPMQRIAAVVLRKHNNSFFLRLEPTLDQMEKFAKFGLTAGQEAFLSGPNVARLDFEISEGDYLSVDVNCQSDAGTPFKAMAARLLPKDRQAELSAATRDRSEDAHDGSGRVEASEDEFIMVSQDVEGTVSHVDPMGQIIVTTPETEGVVVDTSRLSDHTLLDKLLPGVKVKLNLMLSPQSEASLVATNVRLAG